MAVLAGTLQNAVAPTALAASPPTVIPSSSFPLYLIILLLLLPLFFFRKLTIYRNPCVHLLLDYV